MKYLLVISVVLNVGFTTFLIIYQQNNHQKLIELEEENIQLKSTLKDYLSYKNDIVQTTDEAESKNYKAFKEVKIGNQIWMTENLNVDKFRNGDPIPEVKTDEEWEKAGEEGQPAWCYYDNDSSNGKIYGKLYNWYAVNDPRGLAPNGYHIPYNFEWDILIGNLGGIEVAGKKMKSNMIWNEKIKGETNNSGFSALPSGFRGKEGSKQKETNCYWWSSSEYDDEFAWLRNLHHNAVNIDWNYFDKGLGLSVRCVKD